MAINEWILYYDCDKCGRSDYCKFVKKDSYNNTIDIKCGVVKDVIGNYFNTTFELATELKERESRQAYINVGFYLARYTFQSETYIGMIMEEETMKWWDSYAPAVIGFTKSLRDLLDKLHIEMSKVYFLNSLTTNLYVEGDSEKIIVTNFIASDRVSIVNYKGKGRMIYDKMEYLFKTNKEKGYKNYVQGDLDGTKQNQKIESMITKGLLDRKDTFLFKHDLETSYPIELLHEALLTLPVFNTPFEEFKSDIYMGKSIVVHIKDKYGIEIPKTDIAEYISKKINVSMLNNEEFKKTEFGKFLSFCFRSSVQQ